MKCPKCGGEIGRFELSPNCKHCGVNIFYSQQKTLLTRDAKRCELEYAGFRIMTAKLKNAFVGGKLQIFRIVAMVLAIGCIMVPFATVSSTIPLIDAKLSFGALGIFNGFSDGTLAVLFNLMEYIPSQVGLCLSLLGLIVAIFLTGFGVFVALVLSFLNIQKSARITRVLSVIGGILCIAASVVSILAPSVMGKCGFLQGSLGIGSFLCVAIFVVIFILNHLIVKKNIHPEIKQVDIDRKALNKKVKAGEVSLDDLPLPVFETEEERELRLKNEAESKALADKGRAGE